MVGVDQWQFKYNGLLFGANTAMEIMNIEGLNPPSTKITEMEKAEAHGSFTYGQFAQSRRLVIEGDLIENDIDQYEALVDKFRTTFTPQSESLPLTFLIPGSIAKRIYCIPTRLNFAVDNPYSWGYMRWSLEMLAGDPYIYSDDAYTVDLLPQVNLGVDLPIDFSFSFGGYTGDYTASVSGALDAYPTIRIYGPVVNPKILNDTYDEVMSLNLTIAPDDYLDIDFLERTIMLNGTVSRYGKQSSDSVFFTLRRGIQTLRFLAEGSDATTVAEVTWRSTWL